MNQLAEPDAPSLGAMAGLSLLEGRARRYIALGMAATSVYKAVRKWHQRLVTAASYQVTVEGDDDVYPDLQAWLVEQAPPEARRSVHASTRRRGEAERIEPEGAPAPERRLRLAMDAREEQTVTVAGRAVKVTQSLPEWIGQASGVDASRFRDLMRCTFTCPDQDSRDAVLDLIAGLAASQGERPPRLHVVARWGGWTRREFPPRPLETVVLPEGQAERIEGDLSRFLEAEEDYARLGTPWHRGYLFHGPPGTGKTSLARALSTRHRLDLYFLPLSAVANDAALFELLAAVPDRSMLLIEDVDVAHAARERTDGEKGVTMSGLLNALDGVATPHGLVTVITTNDVSVIDPALMRRGRADLVEKFDVMGTEQLIRIARRLGGVGAPLRPWRPDSGKGSVAADAVEVIKAHLGDPARMEEALSALP